MFKKGDQVAVKDSVLCGNVIGAAVDGDLNVSYLVEYADLDGITQQRYFPNEEIEAV